jgi:hypothetical protein
MASSVDIQRGSVGAMNLQSGMSSREASSASVSWCWTNAPRAEFQPRSMIWL